MRHARVRLLVALSGRRVLVPVTLLVFAVAGVFAYKPNPVQGSWAVTAVLSTPLCAWLVAAVEREVGPSADAILTVLVGGAERAWRGSLVLVALLTVVVTLVFMAWPAASSAFERSPGVGDVVIVGGWLASIGLAGAIGPLAGPGAVADALARTPDDALSGALVLASAVAFAQAGLLAYGARRLARWRG